MVGQEPWCTLKCMKTRELTNFRQVRDLRYPIASEEAAKHKLKRLVPSPNGFFMDVKCSSCYNM